MIEWDKAEFADAPENALSTEIDGVTITFIVEPTAFQIAWAVRLGGFATLPDAELLARAGTAGIVAAIRDMFGDDINFEPGGRDDPA